MKEETPQHIHTVSLEEGLGEYTWLYGMPHMFYIMEMC